ncbi:hypothetical protein ACA910_008595 [Epithemia clementina (nom. ined.)]
MSTALDFRDIHKHPPDATKLREPLPADPSWDAHKVYFNERERGIDKKGDVFDDFFTKEKSEAEEKGVLEATLNSITTKKKEDDETLDPLGWPVDAFRSFGGRVQSFLVSNATGDEDDDGDDLDLIRKSDEDAEQPVTSTAASLLSSLGVVDVKTANEMVEGVQNLFLFGSTTTTASTGTAASAAQQSPDTAEATAAAMKKEERIRMYETSGVDDESSVEENDDFDEEDWEKDREVGYIAQSGSSEDLDDILLDNKKDKTTTSRKKSSDVPDFALVSEADVPTFEIPTNSNAKQKSQKDSKKSSVPVIRPPPAEKLEKWEQAKARPLQHLQASKKK